jgi:hypothetical protein
VLNLRQRKENSSGICSYVCPRSGVLSQKLVTEVVEKFSDSYQTPVFITVFRRAHHLSSVVKLKGTGYS